MKTEGPENGWNKAIEWFFLAVVLFMVGLICLSQQGCTSAIVPKAVASHEASFDGNQQNSGVLEQRVDGFVVTQNLVDRYNELIKVYGRDYKPALGKMAGATPEGANWLIDREHFKKFLEMNAWQRAGLHPLNP